MEKETGSQLVRPFEGSVLHFLRNPGIFGCEGSVLRVVEIQAHEKEQRRGNATSELSKWNEDLLGWTSSFQHLFWIFVDCTACFLDRASRRGVGWSPSNLRVYTMHIYTPYGQTPVYSLST